MKKKVELANLIRHHLETNPLKTLSAREELNAESDDTFFCSTIFDAEDSLGLIEAEIAYYLLEEAR